MKTTIYYFTGTGNSLKCTRDLAAKLGGAEIVPIIDAVKEDLLPGSDRLGIVFPVYVWGLPMIVDLFLSKLSRRHQDSYIFAVATNGGAVSGALLMAEKKLRAKGLKLSAGFSVSLPSNFISTHQTSPEQQQQLFAAADIKMDKMVAIIQSGRRCNIGR